MPSVRNPRRFAQLSLESLEKRLTPSGGPGNGGNAPPVSQILTMEVQYELGRTVKLTGELSGVANVNNVKIIFSGAVQGHTFTDSTGNYEVILDADQLGMVQAVAEGTSAAAMQQLWDEAPSIVNFNAIERAGHIYNFTGTVTYHRVFHSIKVYFGGAPISLQNESTTVNHNGHLNWSKLFNGLGTDNGLAWARAESPWGLLGEKVYVNIHQTGT